MRLVIHLGATKTASTFLQQCLLSNEDVLRRHGVYLPKTGRLPWSTDVISHHNLAWELYGDRRFKEAHGRWSDMLKETSDSGAETVLLSSEAFARLASDPQLKSFMARRLAECSSDVRLIYVVREPLARINSMYAQSIKTFAAPITFDEYVGRAISSGLYELDKAYRYWYDSGPATFVALRFDEIVREGPFYALLRAADIQIPRRELSLPDDVVNPSPGPMAVEALRLLNARVRVMDPTFSRRSAASTKLSQVAQRRAWKMGWYEDPYWGWEPEAAERVAKRLRGSNQRFASAVWGTDWPLPLPVERPRRTVNLLEADKLTHETVNTYLKAMMKRYRDLLVERRSRSGAAATSGRSDGEPLGQGLDDDG